MGSDGYPYSDLSDPGGKTTAVYAIDGSIAMGLDRSTRRICLTFSAAPLVQIGSPSLLPLTGCHPGKVHVRPAIDHAGIGITNLGVDQSWPQSFIVYWTGFGADERQHDYELGFRLRDQNAVTATARNTDNDISTAEQWTIEQIVPWGRVSVFQSGKGGGWRPLADYNMPFAAVAYRLIPNRRK